MADLALLKRDTVDIVAQKVRQYQESGELHFPADYSIENAMKSAWLALQAAVDKSGKPALEVCTKDSIANSLLDMAIQGLNPAKDQCYFVVYGSKLVCMRSYFGSMAVVKTVAGATDVWAEVVYKGDEFTYEIAKGRKTVTKHVQKLENVKVENIAAAYAVIEFGGTRPDHVEIMTIDEIKRAWAQGQTYKPDGNGVHQKFAEEMAKKTVINRACKAFINSSNDSSLLIKAFNRADDVRTEEAAQREIDERANREVIDIETGEITDAPPAENLAGKDGATPTTTGQGATPAEAPKPGPGF
jgi:recombination protein RecT